MAINNLVACDVSPSARFVRRQAGQPASQPRRCTKVYFETGLVPDLAGVSLGEDSQRTCRSSLRTTLSIRVVNVGIFLVMIFYFIKTVSAPEPFTPVCQVGASRKVRIPNLCKFRSSFDSRSPIWM